MDCDGAISGTIGKYVTIATDTGETPDGTPAKAGIASFINVPPSSTTVTVTIAGKPDPLKAIVPVRAGSLTYVTFNNPQWH